MDQAEFGAGAGRHYEYKNIVFQDFYFQEQIVLDPDPDHKSFPFVLPPAAGFTQPDLKIVYEKRKDRLLIQGDRPSGGNRLRRLFHEFQVPEGYQGDKTVAVFQEGNLTLTIPKTAKLSDSQSSQSQTPDDNSDGAETEPKFDPHAAAPPQAESHLAPAAVPVPPPAWEFEHRYLLEALFKIKTEGQSLVDLYKKSKRAKGVWT